MTKLVSFALLAAVLFALGLTAPARAQTANRAWVSGHGTDASGCGAPADPCRSLQYVHDNIIAAGGEIDVLDGAGYGAITITKALSIVANGAVGAVQQSNANLNAITINAGASDKIYLRGLTLEGLGVANDGIQFNSGASLDIVDCVVRHFTNAGIDILSSTANSRVSISRTLASDNNSGVYIQPSASLSAALKGVIANDNSGDGIAVFGEAAGVSVHVSAVDSEANGNVSTGFIVDTYVSGASASLSLRNVTASNNRYGINSDNNFIGSATLTIGRSLISGNFYGAVAPGSATIFSYGDNTFSGNNQDVDGNFFPITAQ